MSTLIKIIVTSILSLSLSLCNVDLGLKGSGKVVSENLNIDQSFNEIVVSNGLDFYLTQKL
ncbi:MAG TPA: hypothetical protein VNJ50_05460 [Gelidibacter sp.]|uniref:hypothetical protein n=1 Tax=Gelidibacter sp. TaxID=2018083 RepID=UPI002BC9CDA7|nr:hypothetical protein [Gelidibacter sp.]HXJ98273.1 hypothetical protein [Gelidibacter sp.]